MHVPLGTGSGWWDSNQAGTNAFGSGQERSTTNEAAYYKWRYQQLCMYLNGQLLPNEFSDSLIAQAATVLIL
jgi:hypothetical protein